MEGGAKNSTTPPAKACLEQHQVTPEGPAPQWEYTDLIKQIMMKDSKRKLCPACHSNNTLEVKDDTETGKPPQIKCSFYKHESALIDAADNEMKNPKKEYRNKKEQGARLACYKLWTMLEVGRLGRSRRKPLPVCVEARIKLMKPSETFQGYEEKKRRRIEMYLLVTMTIRGLEPSSTAHSDPTRSHESLKNNKDTSKICLPNLFNL